MIPFKYIKLWKTKNRGQKKNLNILKMQRINNKYKNNNLDIYLIG